MSMLSFLTGGALVALVYGLSFLPSASLARPDDEVGLGLIETVSAAEDAGAEAHASDAESDKTVLPSA